MKITESRFFLYLFNIIKPELQKNHFLLGQSSILASRANSSNFKDLWDAEVKVYSQWGEDGILDFLCEKLDLIKPRIIEIGAGNFKECNSRFLLENRNASVFAVDGREDLELSILSNSWRWKSHLSSLQAWVTPANISEIISKAKDFMGGIEIFSLDLDGNDYWILKDADLEGVSIVVVEYNPLFGHRFQVTIPRDDQFDRTKQHYSWLYYGASLKAFEVLLKSKGFNFMGTNRVGNNAFFVPSALASKIPVTIRENFTLYTDWRVREGRTPEGRLSFLSGNDRVRQMGDLNLINLENNSQISVIDAFTH